jgi:hypothetical protein
MPVVKSLDLFYHSQTSELIWSAQQHDFLVPLQWIIATTKWFEQFYQTYVLKRYQFS